MKLTDEQREEIQHEISKDSIYPSVSWQTVRDWLRLLLSSEQAWKEEAKHWQEADINTIILDQLNQAIEVLKWYASFWNHDVQLEDIDITNIQRDRGKKARDFLSSLQEDS